MVLGTTASSSLDLETENHGDWQMEMSSELKESLCLFWAQNNWTMCKACFSEDGYWAVWWQTVRRKLSEMQAIHVWILFAFFLFSAWYVIFSMQFSRSELLFQLFPFASCWVNSFIFYHYLYCSHSQDLGNLPQKSPCLPSSPPTLPLKLFFLCSAEEEKARKVCCDTTHSGAIAL